MKNLAQVKIFGMKLPIFAIFFIITLGGIAIGVLPKGMIGTLLLLMILGELLGFVGDRLPILRTYLGGGVFLCLFGASAIVYFQLLPEPVTKAAISFMKEGGFLNFYICALITGSILGMDPHLLTRAGARFALPLIAAVIFATLFAAAIGFVFGYSVRDAITFIDLPIVGGGMGAGAVPMGQIYQEVLGKPVEYYMSIIVPNVILGNVLAIIMGGLLNRLGQRYPRLSGNGVIMPGFSVEEKPNDTPGLNSLGIGLLASLAAYVAGQILGKFIPLHPYALMILLVAFLKIIKVVPSDVCEAASSWYRFTMKNWTFALLIGIGMAYINMAQVIASITLTGVLIIFFVLVGTVVGAGWVGHLVGFYPIEAAIAAGLCMANMGGTGDVATLSAAHRMQLMPFAQISSRIGGALILLICSLLVPLFA